MDLNIKRKSSRNSVIGLVILSLAFGFAGGIISVKYYPNIVKLFPGFFSEINTSSGDDRGSPVITTKVSTGEQEAVIDVVNQSITSVVSILAKGKVSLPEFPYFPQEITAAGSGFIVSSDGMILTNKHVVQYEDVKYTVILQNGQEYEAQVLARDPVQDLAVVKIQKTGLKPLSLGDSENLQIGQTVIAIGNALGEFQNTVSVGVVSGLSREITAGGGGTIETIEEVIQTDAAINQGNSGGPLLNLSGQVIGVNIAMASGAENISFALPINKAKKAITDVKEKGKISYPFLGVSYRLINETLQATYNLPVSYGAWVIRSEETEPAVISNSGADKAGIEENDIILEIDGKRVTEQNSLSKMILAHEVGDKIKLKLLRKGKIIETTAKLGKHSQ